jgi:hypothetical protein
MFLENDSNELFKKNKNDTILPEAFELNDVSTYLVDKQIKI